MDVQNTVANDLLRQYGPIINSEQIAKILGYRTDAALQKAIQRKRVPFPVTRLPGRKGWFARTHHAAAWIEQAFPDYQEGAPMT
jgi:hypothetical protein